MQFDYTRTLRDHEEVVCQCNVCKLLPQQARQSGHALQIGNFRFQRRVRLRSSLVSAVKKQFPQKSLIKVMSVVGLILLRHWCAAERKIANEDGLYFRVC